VNLQTRGLPVAAVRHLDPRPPGATKVTVSAMTAHDATAAVPPQVRRSFPDSEQQPSYLLRRPPLARRALPSPPDLRDPTRTGTATGSGPLAVCGSCLFLATGAKGDILVVDPARPRGPHRVLGRHGGHVTALVVSGGVLLSAGCDVLLVGRALPGDENLAAVVGSHTAGITRALAAPDGRLVTAGHDGQVLAWRAGSREILASHPGGVEAVAVLDSGAVVTAGRDGRLLHRQTSGGEVVELRQRRREINVAMASAGRALVTAGGQRGVVRLWDDFTDGGWPEQLGVHGSWVLALVVLDADRVAAVGGEQVTVWDLATGNSTRIPLRPGLHATSAVPLPNGDLAVAGADPTVEVLGAQRLGG
jgi:WD40 repeat protein